MLSCLGLGACVASLTGLNNSRGQQQANEVPIKAAVPVKGLQFVPASDSEVKLQGTSTVGGWTSRSTTIHGGIVLDTTEAQLNGLFDQIENNAADDQGDNTMPPPTLTCSGAPTADISIPVNSLHGGSSGMDHDMQNALNAGQHPAIEYTFQRLQSATVGRNPLDERPELKLSLVGNLRMAGSERSVMMDAIVRRAARRHFAVHTETTMLMSDFGVTPPTALFGLIKGGQKVSITFNLDLIIGQDAATTQSAVKPAQDPGK